jgi:serine/threonine protein kinase
MIIGVTPYYSINPNELVSNIINAKLKLTKNLSSFAKDIIIKLLSRNPISRLGS